MGYARGMTVADIFVLLEGKGNAFGPVFADYGYCCQQIAPQALGSPFCPAFRLLVVPSGFAARNYYSDLTAALERCEAQIGRFVEKGGIVLVYGPLVEEYDYPWLPARLNYRFSPRNQGMKIVMPESPVAGFVRQGTVGCDGYFTEHEGDVVLADEDGKPVLVCQKYGRGHIIAAGTFHYPEKAFVDWACSADRVKARL